MSSPPNASAIRDNHFCGSVPAEFDIARFKALHPQFQTEYPKVEDQKLVEHKFEHAVAIETSLCCQMLMDTRAVEDTAQ